MKYINGQFLQIVFLVSSFSGIEGLGISSRLLEKVHVKTNSNDNDVELATIIFTFNHEPVITPIASKKPDQYNYFLPFSMICTEAVCKQQLYGLQNAKHPKYDLEIKQVNKPKAGIMIAIKGPNIEVSYDVFTSKNNEQRVIVHIYDAQLLKDLSKKVV